MRKYSNNNLFSDKCDQISILKFTHEINQIYNLPVNETSFTTLAGKIAWEAFQRNTLRLNLSPLSIELTQYWKTDIPEMTNYDAARYEFHFDFNEKSLVSIQSSVETFEDSLDREMGKFSIEKLKELILKHAAHNTNNSADANLHKVQLIERLKFINTTKVI